VSGDKNSLARSLCWNCQSEVGGEYFCDHCIKIQPAPSDVDYFQRLGLPRHLTLDVQDLERRFHDLSRKIHPDLFQRRSEEEKAISLQNSAMLNTAYRTLRDPILRVEYLISLEEGAVKDIPAKAPPNLLEEIMELQETLEEFKRVRGAVMEKGKELKKILIAERDRLAARKEIFEKELLGLFQEWDRFQDQRPLHADGPQKHQNSLLRRMKELLSARAYLKTLLQDLDEGLRDHS